MCATGSCLDDDDSFGGVEDDDDDDDEAVDEVAASRSDVRDIVGSCLDSY